MERTVWLTTILGRSLAWRGCAPWLLAVFVAVNVYVEHGERRWTEERRANLLAPSARADRRAQDPPRFDWSVGEHLGDYWTDIPNATFQPLVILSGMSQMYAINEAKAGDETIVELLDDRLRKDGVRAFGLAAPNLDNEEGLLYLVAALSDPRTSPATFIYGVCFDKFRNVDIRPGLVEFLRSHAVVQNALRAVCLDRTSDYPQACEKLSSTLAQMNHLATEDRDFEGRLRAEVGRFVPVVHARADLNAYAQMRLFAARNALLGIKATSKRPLLADRYELNRQLLGLMADVAKARGVRLILYVIPLNPTADNPYVPTEYEAFRRWVASFAKRRSIAFADLDGLVPHEDWGLLNGEPDFKHFREEGHRRVADALYQRFGASARTAPSVAARP